jgi:thiol:disulfide interchange protein DsbG
MSASRFVIARRSARTLRWLAVAFACVASSLAAAAGPVDANFARLEKADAVVEGANDPKFVLYVLFDANCLYCHLTWKAVQPYEKVGLQVRWIPVAYQQASSVGRAAAIMQAPDRVAAMRINEMHYDAKRFDGGIEPAKVVPKQLAARFAENTQLMKALGAPGTPVVAWKDAAGAIHVKVGMLRLSELRAITGLPAQANDDPELAAFR